MNTIQESVQTFLDEMNRVGYSVKSTSIASAALSKIIHIHQEHECTSLNLQIVDIYIDNLQKTGATDSMAHYLVLKHIWYIRKYIDFTTTGVICADRYMLPKFPFPESFSDVISKYVDEVTKPGQRETNRAWAPKRYAFWLSTHGVASFSESQISDLRQYLIDDCKKLKSKTIPSLRSELRRFHIWLHENGYIPSTYEEFFDFRVAIESKIHPAAIPDDVAKTISQIDRSTSTGKRNYAAIMLAVVLGLRICDIKSLLLTDIDWRRGEIRIVQHKTGKPLALPLTTDVGEALKDYILFGRPEFDDPHVFLRHIAPIGPIKSSTTFGSAYTRYMRKAGVEGEGGLYPLRRAAGKNLVVSGTPVTTVSQVLGHSDISNTKQYISLDTQHLKICSLDFTDIRPRRWCE